MQKLGIEHSCYEVLHPRSIFLWAVLDLPLVKIDPSSIFFISLQKINQSTK